MTEIWVADAPNGMLSPSDRALAYGDGLFATMLSSGGTIQFLDIHLRRLHDGAARLGFSWTAGEALRSHLVQLAIQHPAHCIKLLLSRGCGGRGYQPPTRPQPVLLISIHPLPSHYQQWQLQGIKLARTQVQLGHQPLLAGIKHLNRLEQVLIKTTIPSGVEDVWVQDCDGQVIESSIGNLFFISGEQVLTPALSYCGVAGVMRQQIMEQLLDMGLNVTATAVSPQLMFSANHILMSNSLLGAVAVTGVDNMDYQPWPRLPELCHKLS